MNKKWQSKAHSAQRLSDSQIRRSRWSIWDRLVEAVQRTVQTSLKKCRLQASGCIFNNRCGSSKKYCTNNKIQKGDGRKIESVSLVYHEKKVSRDQTPPRNTTASLRYARQIVDGSRLPSPNSLSSKKTQRMTRFAGEHLVWTRMHPMARG